MLAQVPHPYRRADGEAFSRSVRAGIQRGNALILAIVHDNHVVGGIGNPRSTARLRIRLLAGQAAGGAGASPPRPVARSSPTRSMCSASTLVRSGVFIGNRASIRVQQKLGFAIVGRSLRHSLARGEPSRISTPCSPPPVSRRCARMKFLDQAKIYVRSGDGGNGCVSFPPREVHRVRRARRRRRRQGRRCLGRGGRGPQHPHRLPLPAALQGQDRRQRPRPRPAPAARAPTWCSRCRSAPRSSTRTTRP